MKLRLLVCAVAAIGCGPKETCVEKTLGGVFCIGDGLVTPDEIVNIRLFDVDTCDFTCGTRGSPVCQVVRDGGFIQLQVVGQVCLPASTFSCPDRCRASIVTCTFTGLPLGKYQVGSPGQPSRPLEVGTDGGAHTFCSL